jgi:hypothetical protein
MKFSELAVGEQFNYKNVIYTKINPEKVSCCKRLNAINIENNQKSMIGPKEEVEKVTRDS